MASELDIDLTTRAETPIAVGGLLVDSNLFLRGSTDVHFLKNSRNVIASELKSASAFTERTVWYRDSRGIQALSAMYAFKCPTFLASQKRWKLIVLNSSSDGILTYPFEEKATMRAGSTLTKELGPTFLKAICICILSTPDGAALESGTSAMEAETPQTTPEAKKPRPHGSVEKTSKKISNSEAGAGYSEPHSGEGAGKRTLGGDAVHQRVRVLADCDMRTIEAHIASAELASASARRAAEAGRADVAAA